MQSMPAMTRAQTSYRDAKGVLHPTPRAAILADIQQLIGRPASIIAVEHAAALRPLLCELCEAEETKPVKLRGVANG